ncbi:MAG: hypothetical protein ABIR50_05890 [Ginsengibacter sp.]
MQIIIKEMGTRQFLKSTATGSFIGIVIGLLWFIYGVSLISEPYKYILLILSLVITFFLLRNVIKVTKKGNEMLTPTRPQTNSYKKKIILSILNAIAEIILLNIVFYYLIKIGQEKLIIPAISIIVGLHFIPMAVFLRIKQFYISSSIMIISGIIFIILSNKLKENTINIFQSILNALALWLTIIASLKNISKSNFHLDKRRDKNYS